MEYNYYNNSNSSNKLLINYLLVATGDINILSSYSQEQRIKMLKLSSNWKHALQWVCGGLFLLVGDLTKFRKLSCYKWVR